MRSKIVTFFQGQAKMCHNFVYSGEKLIGGWTAQRNRVHSDWKVRQYRRSVSGRLTALSSIANARIAFRWINIGMGVCRQIMLAVQHITEDRIRLISGGMFSVTIHLVPCVSRAQNANEFISILLRCHVDYNAII